MKNLKQTKLRVGILFGGKSAEHEISIQSAKNVIGALDKSTFVPVLIGIDKQGGWHTANAPDELERLTASAGPDLELLRNVDVVFPILHGPLGEDGTMQGLLEIVGLPYVGCGVLGSAIAMDKEISKLLLQAAGVKITDYMVLTASERQTYDLQEIVTRFGLPLFVKPANMGSSIGVSRVENEQDLLQAIDLAFQYDRKILIEKAVIGDEVECAVLGNDQPEVSVPGRIIPRANYYSYEAKYHDEDGTVLEIPAILSEVVMQKVRSVALKAFKALQCADMARVDMFVTKQGDVFVNEINTIPGFTKFSMYPQLWEASGITYTDLITNLLELAIDRPEQRKKLAPDHKV